MTTGGGAGSVKAVSFPTLSRSPAEHANHQTSGIREPSTSRLLDVQPFANLYILIYDELCKYMLYLYT